MKTHWKKLDNPNYLGAYSLLNGSENTEITALITKVQLEKVKTERGTEDCRVMYLEGYKPMILNSTNSKTIQKIYNTPYIEDWKGKYVTIYVAKIKAFGEMVDALRVKMVKPAPPELTPSHKMWGKVKDALKNGYTVEQIKQKYTITENNIKLLLNDK